MTFPVFDLHCDTALALLNREGRLVKDLSSNDLHIDLTRAGELSGYAQCFACFTTTLFGHSPQLVFECELSAITAQIECHNEKMRLVSGTDEIIHNLNNGIMSAILTIEGPAGFNFDPGRLEQLRQIGFRMTTLGWNEQNPLTGSHVTGGGLSARGKEYVKKAQSLNMLVDVSHISDEGFWDIMEITEKPVIASHSNSRNVCNVSRNLTDDMFLAICQTGGVVGINLYTEFLGPDADLETVCRHIFHFMELDPTGKHVALGGDLDGCEAFPVGFNGIQDYNKLAQCLLAHGMDNTMVRDIFWNNAVGVMKGCCI